MRLDDIRPEYLVHLKLELWQWQSVKVESVYYIQYRSNMLSLAVLGVRDSYIN